MYLVWGDIAQIPIMASINLNQLFNVSGVVAVITGGGSGLGLMMANALAENGAAKVYIIGRREESLKMAATKYPNIIVPLCGDVTSQPNLTELSNTVFQQTGYINLLITNAGTSGPGLKGVHARATVADFVKAAWASPMSEFNDVYGLNCTSVYYTILAFLELLDNGNQRKNCAFQSQVIATASMAGYMRDPRWGFAYCSSKAALVSMIKCFSTYCVPWGIRFNAIAAGLFPTEMSMPLLAPFKISKEKELDEEGAFAKSYLPAERAGSKEDIAGAIIYLVSRAGAYVNGSIMLVDGGKLSVIPATY